MFSGITFLERCARCLLEVAGHVIIAARRDQRIPEIDFRERATIQWDSLENQGPLRGLCDALLTARDARVSHALVWPCDCPRVCAGVLSLLAVQARGRDAAIPKLGGRLHPLNACYDVRVAGVLEEYLKGGGRKAHEFCGRLDTRIIEEHTFLESGISPDVFCNINTPEEYRHLLGRGEHWPPETQRKIRSLSG